MLFIKAYADNGSAGGRKAKGKKAQTDDERYTEWATQTARANGIKGGTTAIRAAVRNNAANTAKGKGGSYQSSATARQGFQKQVNRRMGANR